jgi:hypothetical protein
MYIELGSLGLTVDRSKPMEKKGPVRELGSVGLGGITKFSCSGYRGNNTVVGVPRRPGTWVPSSMSPELGGIEWC